MGIFDRLLQNMPPRAPPPRSAMEAKKCRERAIHMVADTVLRRLAARLGPNGIDRLHPTDIGWQVQRGDHPVRGTVTPRLVHAVLSEMAVAGTLTTYMRARRQ